MKGCRGPIDRGDELAGRALSRAFPPCASRALSPNKRCEFSAFVASCTPCRGVRYLFPDQATSSRWIAPGADP